MRGPAWSWAELDEDQLELVDEAERELHADYVLVYREGAGSPVGPLHGVEPEPLDEDGVERLRGLEEQLGGVAVAYRRRS